MATRSEIAERATVPTHYLVELPSTLSVIGVGVTTRVHVAGPLFDDFFYTDRAEI